MFGFLKDKLKKAIGTFSKSAEHDIKEEKIETPVEKLKKEVQKKEAPKPVVKETPKKVEEKKPEPKPEVKEVKKEEKKKEEPKIEDKKVELKKDIPKHEDSKDKSRLATKPNFAPIGAGAKSQKPPAVENLRDEKKTKEEIKVEKKKEELKKPEEKKGFFSKLFGKKEEKAKETPIEEQEEIITEEIEEEIKEEVDELAQEEIAEEQDEEELEDEKEIEEELEKEVEEKKGFFGKLTDAFTKKTLTPEKFDELFWELEVAMLENNVAVEVIEKIKSDLRDELTTGKVSRAGLEDAIKDRLRKSIEELFDVPTFDLIQKIKQSPKPFKICIIGVNGSGKTTTLAKIIHLLQKNNLSVAVAASDTFRAAAIDQLKEHTDKLGVKLISHGYGADPAAVAFDAIEHAKSKGIDVVLIDTAGRLHSNTNLMQELEKVVRVNKPDLKLFVGEAITGNDCIEQATVFNKLVGIDAMILSKADVDEKGGASISVSFVTGKPILYFGTGQRYEDLVPFDKEKIIESLDL